MTGRNPVEWIAKLSETLRLPRPAEWTQHTDYFKTLKWMEVRDFKLPRAI